LDEAFVTAREAIHNRALAHRKGYAETSPQGTFLAPSIARVIPECKFIHLVRSPLSVINSGMRRGWYNGHSFDKTRILPRESTPDAGKWGGYDLLQKNAWLWSETNRWIQDFVAGVSSERVLMLKAENLFSQNEDTIEKLYAFLGHNRPSPRSIGRVLTKKLNAQLTSQPLAWTQEQKVQVHPIVDMMAKTLGY
jgi:hypothetical protein